MTAGGQRADGAPAADQSGERGGRWNPPLMTPVRWTGRLIAGHRAFTVVLVVAAALRAVVILGYPPIFWYNDSYNYVIDAVTRTPDVVRSNGYPFFLQAIEPFHSLLLLDTLP